MKNAVFWDVTPCGPCKNRRFGGKAVATSLILFTMMMEAILSVKTSVLIRATRSHIAEDGVLPCISLRQNLIILCMNYTHYVLIVVSVLSY
jgi:hypothetical protein